MTQSFFPIIVDFVLYEQLLIYLVFNVNSHPLFRVVRLVADCIAPHNRSFERAAREVRRVASTRRRGAG